MATQDRGARPGVANDLLRLVPPVRVRRSTSQTGSADFAINFDGISFDPEGWWTSSSPSRLTCPTNRAGKYQIAGALDFDAASGAVRTANIRKNGSKTVEVVGTSGSAHQAFQVLDLLTLAAGDYIELWGYNNGAGSVGVGNFQPWLGLSFLGP